MKIAFLTLGCKVNQYESQALGELLVHYGHTLTDKAGEADVYIINSCTVTAEADRKTRQQVRRYKREHPNSIVVLTGCLPQAFPACAAALPQADIVLGNNSNHRLPALLNEFGQTRGQSIEILPHESGEPFQAAAVSAFEERTRAFVKIEDGCNRFCSYCIIPYARGRVRSKPLAAIKAELETLAGNGYAEVVLVGINLSAYGQDTGDSFADAVETACAMPGLRRIRLGSLEPDHLTDDILARLANCETLCPQFHISLQSGCDRTLKAMNRHYTAAEYRALCRNLRSRFPGCTLSTDIMVGFCGESDEDFEQSLAFVREMGFENLHVFPYSVRSGTRAAAMEGHVSKEIKTERAARMLALGKEMRCAFLRAQLGKTVEVLFESRREDGGWLGQTANGTPVSAQSKTPLAGTIAPVRLTGAIGDAFCVGEWSKNG